MAKQAWLERNKKKRETVSASKSTSITDRLAVEMKVKEARIEAMRLKATEALKAAEVQVEQVAEASTEQAAEETAAGETPSES